jgi:hypothetical protein
MGLISVVLNEQDESNCYLQLPLMPHECGTSKPRQSAQTASSERAQCVSGNGSSCRALNMTNYIFIIEYDCSKSYIGFAARKINIFPGIGEGAISFLKLSSL